MKKRLLVTMLVVAMATALMGCSNGNGDTEKNSEINSEVNSETEKENVNTGVVEAVADANGNYVFNGSFEEVDFNGWTVTNVGDVTDELDVYTRETDCYEGVQCFHFYSSGEVNFTIEQKLTGLEDGTYKLTGYVQGDTAGDPNSSIYMYAIINGETIKMDTSLNGYLAWNTVELSGLNVTGGEIIIGFACTNAPGGWGTIDAITLVKE